MESLQGLQELVVLAKQVSHPWLSRVAEKLALDDDPTYQACLAHFHLMPHGEFSDFRPAHQQLCEYLYAWNVKDAIDGLVAAEQVSGSLGAGGLGVAATAASTGHSTHSGHAPPPLPGARKTGALSKPAKEPRSQHDATALTRPLTLSSLSQLQNKYRTPRVIRWDDPAELVEMQKLLQIQQTLLSIARRALTAIQTELEASVPRLGHGIAVQGQGGGPPMGPSLAAHAATLGGGPPKRIDPSAWDDDLANEQEKDAIWGSLGGRDDTAASTAALVAGTAPSSASRRASRADPTSGPSSASRTGLAAGSSLGLGAAEPWTAATSSAPTASRRDLATPLNKAKPLSPIGTREPAATVPAPAANHEAIRDENGHPVASQAAALASPAAGGCPAGAKAPSTGEPFDGPAGDVHAADLATEQPRQRMTSAKIRSMHLALDVDLMYLGLDQALDTTIVCQCTALVALGLAYMIKDQASVEKTLDIVNRLVLSMVSSTLKILYEVILLENPAFTIADLRSLKLLSKAIKQAISARGKTVQLHDFPSLPAGGPTPNPRNKARKMGRKLAFLHDLFVLLDIHLFPACRPIHSSGCAVAQVSSCDPYLWMTGGSDGLVRISRVPPSGSPHGAPDTETLDEVASAPNGILAQFVGHKSIVTDVHFTRQDALAISSSFDRTVKVWNTRNATCERTLTDHEDSVVSCDVSHDGHYVASGSLDGTCRLWDLHRGVCLTTIRKHTKWVLCVRFSPDGRYLASSGLDCKVFIWEVKALILGKGMARPRSIEGHTAHISHMQFGTGLGARLYTISKDCTLRCWDYITGQELYHVSTHPLGITCFQLSPNGAFIAAGTVANTILLFHSQTLVQFRAIRVLNLGIMTVKVFLDNAQLLVGTQEGVVQTIPL